MHTLKPRIGLVVGRLAESWRASKTTAAQRGYDYRWQQARDTFLRQHPLCQCEECQGGRLRVTLASVVDHKIPHRGDTRLFWDQSNWQAMAKPCHDRKTATDDGGFGNYGAGAG